MGKLMLIGIIFTSTWLAGCSSTPVIPSQARTIEPIIKYKKRESAIPLTIVRDKGWVSGMCKITVFINGEPVANLDTSEKTTVFVKRESIDIGAGFIGSGVCHGAPAKERIFDVTNKERQVVRIFIDQSGNVDILPTMKE